MAFGRKRKVVPFRSAGELDAMAAAGALVAAALRAVHRAAAPGVSTHDLDQVAEAVDLTQLVTGKIPKSLFLAQ